MKTKEIYYTLADSKLFVELLITFYKISGKRPWSIGYWEARNKEIARLINNQKTLQNMSEDKNLPINYGKNFDERVIEYPWLVSRIRKKDKFVLDAGSIFNFPFVVNDQKLTGKKLVIANLNPERYCFYKTGVSYVYSEYADIRNTCFKNNLFDVIVCSSVLEHVGMDNTFIYSSESKFDEKKTEDYLSVIDELHRLLKKGGRLLLTFPFGKYENLGWLQQFDIKNVKKIIKRFNGNSNLNFYKYTKNGWIKSNEEECKECLYFDIHKDKVIDSINTAAARAVACLELKK